MNSAELSYTQLNPYLKKLIRINLLRNENKMFITTQKGLKYLEKYNNIKPLLK